MRASSPWTAGQRLERARTFNGSNIHSRRYPMNIFKSTSQHQRNLDPRTHPLARRKKLVLATSLMALSCFAFSPAWAGDYSRANSSSALIHLTSVSIHIGPGGFHLGFGVPHYRHGYARPHLHVRPFAKPYGYWQHQKRHGYRHHYAPPKRFGHRHGWKNDRHRGHFRGKGARGGRGNGGHRGWRR